MKNIKKYFAILAAFVLLFAQSAAVHADGESDPAPTPTTYTITVNNTNTAVSINGQTFNAYKVFDVSYNTANGAYAYSLVPELEGYSYAVSGSSYSGDGLIAYVKTLTENSAALQAFAQDVALYLKNNGVNPISATANGQTATITVPTAGYYAVVGDAVSAANPSMDAVHTAVSLTTAAPSATVNVKVDIPTLKKQIVNADSANGAYGNGTAQDVGSDVTFRITSKVPDMAGYTSYTFIVTDTLSKGLTYKGNLSVSIGGTTLAPSNYTVAMGAVDASTGAQTFTIEFKNFINQAANKGKDIVITYKATINENAKTVNVDTNTASLEYSNNPNDDSKTGNTPDSTVYVYNLDIRINKYAANDRTKKLEGAKFVLYYEDNQGVYNYYKKDGDGNATWYQLAKDEVTGEATETVAEAIAAGKITEVVTDQNGAADIEGLDARTYYLLETQAPDGYNLLAGPIEKVIEVKWKSDGTIDESASVDGAQPVYVVDVANSTGDLLPTTGGMGTTLFYLAGGALAVGAAVLLITKKKMSVE